ncbi:MAG: hypothetical protein QME40_01465 [bacterium]|nr:hypothetical protein [bacterium]
MSDTTLGMLIILIGVAIVVIPIGIIAIYQDYKEKHNKPKV